MTSQAAQVQVLHTIGLVLILQAFLHSECKPGQLQSAFLAVQVNHLWADIYKVNNDSDTKTDVLHFCKSASMIKWGQDAGMNVSNNELLKHTALAHGDIKVLDYLFDKCAMQFCKPMCRTTAVLHGHVHVLGWLGKHACARSDPRNPSTDAAANKQWVEINKINWMPPGMLDRAIWDFNSFYVAAYTGHLKVVEWMLANGFSDLEGSSMYRGAVHGGNIDSLIWLKQNKYKWCDDCISCFDAIQTGRLYLLQWLREQGCPWGFKMSVSSPLYNTEAGYWARENGCPVRKQRRI